MKHHRIKPKHRLHLDNHDPGDTGGFASAEAALERTNALREKLALLQERLYAEDSRALLVVLQGLDTAGKDGTIRHVMEGVNPQGCVVTSFKVPTPLENAHDFLWRAHAACPPRGHIGIFNRSHYEDVLVTRAHGSLSDKVAERRLREIRDFETMLTENGTRILKFLLHISKEEQKKRLLARIDDPNKHWKIGAADLEERGYWKSYQRAFEAALAATSTEEAPWFVVPSDHKWYRNLVVAEHLVAALEDMDPRPPEVADVDWDKLRRDVAES